MYRVLLRTCASGYELVPQATQAIYRILLSGNTGCIQSTFWNLYHRRCLDSVTCWPTNKKKSCPRSIDAGGRHRKPTAPALAKKKLNKSMS